MQLSKTNFITTEPSLQFLEVYRELNKTIDDMDKKVQHVIKKHEAEFLYAYRNHISKIKKELAQIKHKSEEQERMFSSNDRIQYLEKEMIIFREEALKLYNRLDQKTQENEILKIRIRDYEKEHSLKEYEEKEKAKTSKLQEMNKLAMENRISELTEEMNRKDEEIARLNRSITMLKDENIRRSQIDLSAGKLASLGSSRRGESLKETIKERTKKIEVYQSQMKEWFLECIRTVKREVAMRNNNYILMDITQITSIEEFKTVDKLRLLELFLQNQKLLTWMYERIFPDRMTQLRSKLISNNQSLLSSERNEKTQKSEKYEKYEDITASHVQKRLLPKVGRSSVRSQLRNSVVIRNGKLNISNF